MQQKTPHTIKKLIPRTLKKLLIISVLFSTKVFASEKPLDPAHFSLKTKLQNLSPHECVQHRRAIDEIVSIVKSNESSAHFSFDSTQFTPAAIQVHSYPTKHSSHLCIISPFGTLNAEVSHTTAKNLFIQLGSREMEKVAFKPYSLLPQLIIKTITLSQDNAIISFPNAIFDDHHSFVHKEDNFLECRHRENIFAKAKELIKNPVWIALLDCQEKLS